jgi:hypothetical protein
VGPSGSSPGTDSNNIFARLDFQLNPEHRLTLRHNFVDAEADRSHGGTGSTSASELRAHVHSTDQLHRGPAELQLRRGDLQRAPRGTHLRPGCPGHRHPFPRFRVDLGGANNVQFGSRQLLRPNALDQDVLEITNDFTFARGSHNFTIGTSNEFFRFSNLFVRNPFGNWRYPSLEASGTGRPASTSTPTCSPVGMSAPSSRCAAGRYAQDRWDVTETSP